MNHRCTHLLPPPQGYCPAEPKAETNPKLLVDIELESVAGDIAEIRNKLQCILGRTFDDPRRAEIERHVFKIAARVDMLKQCLAEGA